MPYLNESNEWRLLDELGRLLDQRKSRYPVSTGPLRNHKGVEVNAELIEVELRRVFIVKQISRNLEPEEFDQFQEKVKSLCLLLDDLARSPNTHVGTESLAYPRLRALTMLVESTTGELDLACGPNETLFQLPRSAHELRKCQRVIDEYNNVLGRLLGPPSQNPVIRPSQTQQIKKAWDKNIMRNQAQLVLKTLFKCFKCGAPHKVLLKTIEDPDEDKMLSNLQLILSPCLELDLWQEARCDFVNLQSSILSRISLSDICMNLRQHTGQGKSLVLHINDIDTFELFGTWTSPTSSVMSSSLDESLDQLILKGAFRPFNPAISDEMLPARFSTKDRRALAVKLGFCLMNFFDADLTSKRIHLLDCLPYLAFDSEPPATTDSKSFQIGHPTLLSFAKLLLELDFGTNIDIDISPNNSGNRQAWVELLCRAELLQQDRNDWYDDAIRGCLMVHHNITMALSSLDNKHKDVDSIIREQLYEQIVQKLKLGHDSGYGSTRKRQRSESPPRSDHWNEGQDSGSAKTTTPSLKLERAMSENKKQRLTEPQTFPTVSGLIHGETSDLGNSNTLVKGFADSNPRIMFSMRPSRRDDFEIAIICALKHEYDAVSYIFDEFWDEDGDQYGRAAGDTNHYATGRVGNYNVVLVLLVEMGKTNAATAAASMRSSYRGLRLALLTGVCGSVPHGQYGDIFLGDVIISKTVVQYGFGWQYPNMFVRKNTDEDELGRPNKDIRSLVATFETDRIRDQLEQRTDHFLKQLQANVARGKRHGKYDYPGIVKDNLFEPSHRHKHHVSPTCVCHDCFDGSDSVCDRALISSCADLGCNKEQRHIARNRFQAIQQLEHDGVGDSPQPAVYVGAVASGDKVIKSAGERDRLTREAGVIAFETEGAGVWDELPCIVVKGVCDYADSHKHEEWQNYAAAVAAAASKAVLKFYTRTDKP